MVPGRVSVGIIANPASGRDIRRLVAHATTVDNQGKVGIIRRVLIGLGALGIADVFGMPDSQQLVQQARSGLAHSGQAIPDVHLLDMAVTHHPEDSRVAAERMDALGVGCIVVLGGDGTVRMVAKGTRRLPLLPISTGTNNVLPQFIEGTVAGLAAAAVARGLVSLEKSTYRHKQLDVTLNDMHHDSALVDLALLRSRFVGARAVWRVEDLQRIAVTRAAPDSIGITSIAAMAEPVRYDVPYGLELGLSQSSARRVLALLGPGLIESVGVASIERLGPGRSVVWDTEGPSVLAFDGEREMALKPGDRVQVLLCTDGPRIVETERVMGALVSQRLLKSSDMEAQT